MRIKNKVVGLGAAVVFTLAVSACTPKVSPVMDSKGVDVSGTWMNKNQYSELYLKLADKNACISSLVKEKCTTNCYPLDKGSFTLQKLAYTFTKDGETVKETWKGAYPGSVVWTKADEKAVPAACLATKKEGK